MAHRKAGGSAKNLRDSNPKYLGVKLSDGQKVKNGNIIIRQRGYKYLPGKNIGVGKDHTLFSKTDGTVKFKDKKRHLRYNGSIVAKKVVDVIEDK